MSHGRPLPRLPAAGLRSLFANHRSGPVPAVRHERADLTHSDAEALDQVPRISGRTAHRSTPGATEARWRLPVHSSNHALEPAPQCRLGSPRARRLANEHIARLCPLTDIDGSTGSTRCALGRGTSTGTTWSRETHPHQPRAATAARRRKQLLLVGGLFVFVVVVGLLGLSAYRSALRAKTSLEAARAVISKDLSDKQAFQSSAGRAKLASDIKTVEADADNASAILQGSIGMRVFRYVPFLNDQPNGIVNLVDDVRTTAVTGATLLQRVNTLVAQSSGTTVSLGALQSLQTFGGRCDDDHVLARSPRRWSHRSHRLGSARLRRADSEDHERSGPGNSDSVLRSPFLGGRRSSHLSDRR